MLFREVAPSDIQTSGIPEKWATDEGYLRLRVAKGTLVLPPNRCAAANLRRAPRGARLPPCRILQVACDHVLEQADADSDADTVVRPNIWIVGMIVKPSPLAYLK